MRAKRFLHMNNISMFFCFLTKYFFKPTAKGLSSYYETITKSGAVSKTHLQEMAKLVASCGGDGRSIIERLRHKAVSGFRTEKVTVIENYLIENGFITDEPRLSVIEIYHSACLGSVNDINNGLLSVQDIQVLVGTLPNNQS